MTEPRLLYLASRMEELTDDVEDRSGKRGPAQVVFPRTLVPMVAR